MKITVKSGSVLHQESDLGVMATFEDVALPEEIAGLLEPNDYRGRTGQTVLLYPRGAVAPRRLLLVGLGKRESVTAESVRRAAAEAVRRARELQVASLSIGAVEDLPLDAETIGQAFAEGLDLGAYRYWKYRTGLTTEQTFAVESATIYADDRYVARITAGVTIGQIVARGVALARDMVNSPGYAMTPARMGEEALDLGARLGLKTTVLDKAQLTEGGFGGILAVGQGSANDSRFIIMEYGQAAEDTPTICLVGKGLTFDSGGLSIKPA